MYMIYQQYKTAVADGYRGRPREEIDAQIDEAVACRRWLESLEIASDVRDVLVEQIETVETAFRELLTETAST